MIPQAVAIINGKGGTLKTTIAANAGGLLAHAGYKVLLVDFDPQGNLLCDLGRDNDPINDQGAGLAAALRGLADLKPAADVRPGLDLAVGGDALDDFMPEPDDLDQALAPVADQYDLILIDCPPGIRSLQIAALTTARFVVIPTKPDTASLKGLSRVAALFGDVRAAGNPALELLGVVLVDVGSQSRKILRDTRDDVERLFGTDETMFLSTIRHAQAPAVDSRKLGVLAHELNRDTVANAELPTGPLRFAASAPGLAGDHQRLAGEIAERITAKVAS